MSAVRTPGVRDPQLGQPLQVITPPQLSAPAPASSVVAASTSSTTEGSCRDSFRLFKSGCIEEGPAVQEDTVTTGSLGSEATSKWVN